MFGKFFGDPCFFPCETGLDVGLFRCIFASYQPKRLVGAIMLRAVLCQVYVEHMSGIWFVSDVRLRASASNFHPAMPLQICRF